jgi:outer membrane protein OmpA-like peptidoglycan-associated protein
MTVRFCLCLILVPMLAACSAVPDRYAPWRDNDAAAMSAGHTPNLGDVPAAPNVADAKAQMDEMRQRLETDRNNAYMTAQGVVPQGVNTPPPIVPGPNSVTGSDLAPPSASAGPVSSVTPDDVTSIPLPAPQTTQQNTQTMAGNVYYNYDPNIGNDYNYGSNAPVTISNADMSAAPVLTPPSTMVSDSNSSVAIDMSVLGGPSMRRNRAPSSGGITAGEPIAYFAHGSAKLGPKDRNAIRELASQLKQRPQPIMLAGNSSRRTGISNTELSRVINLKMSERRANAVMDELINLGISPEQIFVSAYGDAVPNRRQDDGHNEAANRRVEVLFDQ